MLSKTIKLSDLNLPSLSEVSLPGSVKELIKSLKNQKSDVFLIGGFVRDLILGRSSYDLDFIVIDKSPVELCKELSKSHEGNYFVLDKETETTRFVLKDDSNKTNLYTFDFTPVLKQNLEADFKRRDFTINTLAINLKEEVTLIDKFSGLSDLKNKIIKTPELKNLTDDPLRFLRAFRFACLIQGEIDPGILDFIKSNLTSFNDNIARERISHELWKIFDSNNSNKYIKQMSDIRLLEKIIPELTSTRKVTPNDFHHLWLYDHSIELIKTFEENFNKIPDWAQEELNKPFSTLESPSKKAVAKLGSLLHDIGKPDTWEIKKIETGEKHTFYGHDKLGAEITEKIAERLKFSNAIIETLKKLVRYHLRPFQLSQNNAPITERALYRFFRDVGDDTPLLLMLSLADHHATLGPKVTKEILQNGEKLLLSLLDEYKKYEIKETEKLKKPKLLDGNEIIKLTNLKPSPKLGEIIKELDEAIAVGEIKTKEEAKHWIMKNLK